MTIIEFLTARLNEDETLANDAALMSGWDGYGQARIASGSEWVASYHVVKRKRAEGEPTESRKGREVADCGNLNLERARHIARHDPSRVLADIAAKRAIIELHSGEHDCTELRIGTYPDDWPEVASWGKPGGEWRHASVEHFEEDQPCPTLRLLTSVYSNYPDYNPDWNV